MSDTETCGRARNKKQQDPCNVRMCALCFYVCACVCHISTADVAHFSQEVQGPPPTPQLSVLFFVFVWSCLFVSGLCLVFVVFLLLSYESLGSLIARVLRVAYVASVVVRATRHLHVLCMRRSCGHKRAARASFPNVRRVQTGRDNQNSGPHIRVVVYACTYIAMYACVRRLCRLLVY